MEIQKGTDAPDPTTLVPDTLSGVGFMMRDSRRFPDSGGWGWAQFKYDAASDRFTPWTTADNPPQGNDAKCGFACHTVAKARDYVFGVREALSVFTQPASATAHRFGFASCADTC